MDQQQSQPQRADEGLWPRQLPSLHPCSTGKSACASSVPVARSCAYARARTHVGDGTNLSEKPLREARCVASHLASAGAALAAGSPLIVLCNRGTSTLDNAHSGDRHLVADEAAQVCILQRLHLFRRVSLACWESRGVCDRVRCSSEVKHIRHLSFRLQRMPMFFNAFCVTICVAS